MNFTGLKQNVHTKNRTRPPARPGTSTGGSDLLKLKGPNLLSNANYRHLLLIAAKFGFVKGQPGILRLVNSKSQEHNYSFALEHRNLGLLLSKRPVDAVSKLAM